jgi:hypothetical protein
LIGASVVLRGASGCSRYSTRRESQDVATVTAIRITSDRRLSGRRSGNRGGSPTVPSHFGGDVVLQNCRATELPSCGVHQHHERQCRTAAERPWHKPASSTSSSRRLR